MADRVRFGLGVPVKPLAGYSRSPALSTLCTRQNAQILDNSTCFDFCRARASQHCVINGLPEYKYGDSQGCLIRATGSMMLRNTPTSRSIEGKSVPNCHKERKLSSSSEDGGVSGKVTHGYFLL